MNKKGFAGLDLTQWLLRLLFLTVVVFTCVFLIRMYIVNNVDIVNTEMDLFTYRVLYSPNGIMKVDESLGRVYPGVIDIEKFRDGENITSRMIDYGDTNYYIAAKFWLKEKNEVFYYNKGGYDMWKPLTGIGGGTDLGSVASLHKEIFVLVDNEKDTLVIDVVSPKS